MKKIIFSLFVLTLFANPVLAQFRVVGYLPYYNPNNYLNLATNIDHEKVTHVYVAFLNPNATGDLSGPGGSTANLAAAVDVLHNNNVKVLASLAGAISQEDSILRKYWTNLLSDANRANFVSKITQFAVNYELDGIDVDLEGNMIDANYTKFIVALHDSLEKHNKIITAAVARWNGYAITDAALAKFDFINLMAYDKKGPWVPDDAGPHSTYNHAVEDLNYWATTRNVPKNKLVLGVPFYGHYFGSPQATSYSFNHIVGLAAGNENVDQYTSANGTYYYNGIPTIIDKTNLAIDGGYGGIMIWELTQDATGAKSLLTAIDEVVKNSIDNDAPSITFLTPTKDSTAVEGSAIKFTANASDLDGAIEKVEYHIIGMKLGEVTTSPFTFNYAGFGAGTYKVFARARDNIGAYTNSDTITIVVTAVTTQVPKHGTPIEIPGKIESEDYDLGGNNVAYYDKSNDNKGNSYRTDFVDIEKAQDTGGGFNVGFVEPDEWLEYTVDVKTTQDYKIIARVATEKSGARFHIEMDGVDVTGQKTIQSTGTWQSWGDQVIPSVRLAEGVQVLRVVFDFGEFNLNYLEIVPATPTTSTNQGGIVSYMHLYPNPVQDNALTSFSLRKAGHVKIQICDLSGKEIKVVMDDVVSNTEQLVPFSTSDLEKGLYLVKIITSEGMAVQKMVKN